MASAVLAKLQARSQNAPDVAGAALETEGEATEGEGAGVATEREGAPADDARVQRRRRRRRRDPQEAAAAEPGVARVLQDLNERVESDNQPRINDCASWRGDFYEPAFMQPHPAYQVERVLHELAAASACAALAEAHSWPSAGAVGACPWPAMDQARNSQTWWAADDSAWGTLGVDAGGTARAQSFPENRAPPGLSHPSLTEWQ